MQGYGLASEGVSATQRVSTRTNTVHAPAVPGVNVTDGARLVGRGACCGAALSQKPASAPDGTSGAWGGRRRAAHLLLLQLQLQLLRLVERSVRRLDVCLLGGERRPL